MLSYLKKYNILFNYQFEFPENLSTQDAQDLKIISKSVVQFSLEN